MYAFEYLLNWLLIRWSSSDPGSSPVPPPRPQGGVRVRAKKNVLFFKIVSLFYHVKTKLCFLIVYKMTEYECVCVLRRVRVEGQQTHDPAPLF